MKELDGRIEVPEAKDGPYSYFTTVVELDFKQYRLIWLLRGPRDLYRSGERIPGSKEEVSHGVSE